MNRKQSNKLRPSPNEEARLIREERERRRKLRIQQVREQQRHIALQIRQAVEQKRQRELELLGEDLRLDWERQQQEKLRTLQRLYQENMQLLGQGHRSAKETAIKEPDLAAIAQRAEENHAKVEQRYREALKEMKLQRHKEHERQNQLISARRKALQTEKERSAKVVRLPPPPPNAIKNINFNKLHTVKKLDVSAFAATHYNMPESTVDREEDTQQMNAHKEAELEVRRQQELQREETRRREEQLEKTRLRGRQALRKEQLAQDHQRLLVELEHMQQADLLRRRQQVAQMPSQIFQPLYKRQEMRDDFQRETEFAFEDMYTGERKVKGDLVVQLAPEPLPALSTGSQDQELDVTLDEITTPGRDNSDVGTSSPAEASRPDRRQVLTKLLDCIRGQKNQWMDHSSRVSQADSPIVITDQIPERDTTIETGSMTSKKERPAPIKPPQPVLSPPDKTCTIVSSLDRTEPSAAANTPLADDLANRIEEFGEERKKREKELEREKQQQVVLLQELEKQRVKLEQMLLEAQREREHLKDAATQEVDLNQPDESDQDQEVSSVTTGSATELEAPAGEDDHNQRVREYQQRLLEQNQLHQRSVEMACQHLEERQRALQLRYSLTSPTLSAVVRPGHPPLYRPTLRSTTPAVSSFIHDQPQTSKEIPTRESDILAPPPCLPISKLLPNEVEPSSDHSRNQRPDMSSWHTDNIMERETEHLTQRGRPSSLTTEPLPHKPFTTHPSTAIPPQRSSYPIQSTSQSILYDAPPGRAVAQFGMVSKARAAGVPEFQRCVQEQREAVELKQRGRREMQEEQRGFHEQGEAIERHQRQEKEGRQKQEYEKEQPGPDTPSEELLSEDVGQTRRILLAFLLRAIEESNEGTLSHLQDLDNGEAYPHLPLGGTGDSVNAVLLSEPLPPPVRAIKPPVTRIRLGIMEATEQHELSEIQEVETPFNSIHVTGPEKSLKGSSHAVKWNLQEESDLSDRTLETSSVSSSGKRSVDSNASNHHIWRERLLITGTESDTTLKTISPHSSDSGRGANFCGPAATSYRSFTEVTRAT